MGTANVGSNQLTKRRIHLPIAFFIIFVFLVFSTYTLSFAQSSFKCWSTFRPLRYPFIIKQQVIACTNFADLNEAKVSVTKNEIDKIIAEKERQGEEISEDRAIKIAFGRAKIEQFAKQNDISVQEVDFEQEAKDILTEESSFLFDQEQLRGILLQKEVELKAVSYSVADWVILKWFETSDSEIKKLRTDAKKILDTAKADFEKGRPLNKTLGLVDAKVRSTSFLVEFGQSEKWFFTLEAQELNREISVLPDGVSNVLCDDAQCIVLNIYGGNKGEYLSMQEFFGDLKGW